jgi:Lrp/AsnC family transcriptional regulator, regulator for asnA, asnC and gidA
MSERIELDAHDKRLAAIYTEDGLVSVAQAAEHLGVTAPTVRSRLRGLLSRGALRVAGLVDPFKVRGLTLAMVCLTLQSHEELDSKLEKISELENVTWAAVVTGRYDIVVEVALSDEVADLYRFLHEDLSQVGGVSASESFIVMKARRKWTLLPRGVRKRFLAP